MSAKGLAIGGRVLDAMRRPGLFRALLINTTGSIMLKVGSTLLTLTTGIVLARVLAPEGYGLYSYALALTGFIAVPVELGAPTLIVRQVSVYRSNSQWGLLRGVLQRSAQFVLASSALAVLGASTYVWRFGGELSIVQLWTYVWAFALIPVVALGAIRGAALRGLGEVVVGQLPEQLIRPGLLLVLVALSRVYPANSVSPDLAMLLNLTAAAVAFVMGTWMLLRALPQHVRDAQPEYELRYWIKSLLPLSFLAGMQIINSRTDILMLGLLSTSEAVGIYRVAVQGATLVPFGLTAIGMVLQPDLAKAYALRDMKRFERLVVWGGRLALGTALPLGVVFILWGDVVLRVLFGSEYAVGATALGILAAAQVVNVALGPTGMALNMAGFERDTAWASAASALANVGLNAVLIPKFGVEGAALATAASMVLWNTIKVFKVKQRLHIGIWSTQ